MKLFLSLLALLSAAAPVARAEQALVEAATPVSVKESTHAVPLPRANPRREEFANARYLRIGIDGYNVRSSPEFDAAKKENVAFQVSAGALFAIRQVKEVDGGLSVNILVDGEDLWVMVPDSRRRDFALCEKPDCVTPAEMIPFEQAMAALSEQSRSLVSECVVPVSTGAVIADGNEINLAGDVSAAADTSSVPLPLPAPPRPTVVVGVAPQYTGSVPLPPRKPAAPPAQSAAPTLTTATIERGGRVINASEVACVKDTRGQRRPNFSAYQDAQSKKHAFIEYLKPYALEVQQTTGLPASVIIAQAALESGWGTSHLSRKGNNFFGHSCWKRGTRTYKIEIGGHTKKVTGVCDNARPEDQGGYYLTFASPQASLYAYAANLLTANHRHYESLRETVNDAYPGVAGWRKVVDGLAAYARPNPDYRSQVRNLISSNFLSGLEKLKLCQ